jgi:hypothetical protein
MQGLLLLLERDSTLPHHNVYIFQDYLHMYYNTKSSATEAASLITWLNKLHEATLSEVLGLSRHLKFRYSVHKSILMDPIMTEKNQANFHIPFDLYLF